MPLVRWRTECGLLPFRFGNLASHPEDHAMQNQERGDPNPITDQLDQRARQGKPGSDGRAPLSGDSRPQDAAARDPRRRTQEQGQGDLDDDWQDTSPADVAENVAAATSQSDPKRT
jgi:hypothetical protein